MYNCQFSGKKSVARVTGLSLYSLKKIKKPRFLRALLQFIMSKIKCYTSTRGTWHFAFMILHTPVGLIILCIYNDIKTIKNYQIIDRDTYVRKFRNINIVFVRITQIPFIVPKIMSVKSGKSFFRIL